VSADFSKSPHHAPKVSVADSTKESPPRLWKPDAIVLPTALMTSVPILKVQ